MKTYGIEYDGSAGPEDAMAGRAWNVIQIEGQSKTVIAARCMGEDAERIIEGLRAGEIAEKLRAALIAIVARVEGEFDNPELVRWGQLTMIADDVLRIATSTLEGTRA